jgi:hypothetical protein
LKPGCRSTGTVGPVTATAAVWGSWSTPHLNLLSPLSANVYGNSWVMGSKSSFGLGTAVHMKALNSTQMLYHKGTSWQESERVTCRVKFEVFTAVIMKDAVFWDIQTKFLPNKKHITSPLQSLAG